MENKENVLKTDDYLSDVTDKLQTLTLGERKSSPLNKFSLNVWSTPLKTVGNIRQGKGNLYSTGDSIVAPVKFLKSILEKNEISNDEEKVSAAVEKDSLGSKKKAVESCQEMQEITVSYHTNKCSETSSDKFEDCASIEDGSDSYNEEYQSASSSQSEDDRNETAKNLTENFDGIDNENLNDLSVLIPNEFNETQSMIERYLEGSITFVGCVSSSHVDSVVKNEVFDVENMEKGKHGLISDNVEQIFETLENEQTINNNENSTQTEIPSDTLPVDVNDRNLTKRDSLTEILSDLWDNIDEQNVSERSISTSNRECLTVSFLSKELENIENSVGKNIKAESLNRSPNVKSVVNEMIDFMTTESNNQNVTSEEYDKMEVNTSVCQTDIAEEPINEISDLEKNYTETAKGNSSFTLTFEKSTDKNTSYDTSNHKEVNEQQINANTLIPEIQTDTVDEPIYQTSNSENIAELNNGNSSFKNTSYDTWNHKEVNEQQIDANTLIPEIQTVTVDERIYQTSNSEINNAELENGNSSFKNTSYDSANQKEVNEQQIDANTLIPEIQTDTVDEPIYQTSNSENIAELNNGNSSFKNTSYDTSNHKEVNEQQIDANTLIPEIQTVTVDERIYQTSNSEINNAELENGNSSFKNTSYDSANQKEVNEQQIDANTLIPEIQTDTVDEPIYQTSNSENIAELNNGNSSFKNTSYDTSNHKEVNEQQIDANTLIPEIQTLTVNERIYQTSNSEINNAELENGNSSFKNTSYDSANQKEVNEQQIDANTLIPEIQTDTVDERIYQTSNSEINNAELENGNSSFKNTSYDTWNHKEVNEQQIDANTLIPEIQTVTVNERIYQTSNSEINNAELENGNSSFKNTSYDSANQKEVNEQQIDANTLIPEIQTDTVDEPICQTSNSENIAELNNGNSSFKNTSYDSANGNEVNELQIDANTLIPEIQTDVVEEPICQTSNSEINNAELDNGNSSFKHTYHGTSNQNKFNEQQIDANTVIPEVQPDTVEEPIHRTSNSEINNAELNNENSTFNVIEKFAGNVSPYSSREEFDERQINVNTSISIVNTNVEELSSKTLDLENNGAELTNGDSVFSSLTFVRKSIEDNVSCNISTTKKLIENTLIPEINSDIIENPENQIFDLEDGDSEGENGDLSFGSLTVIEKSIKQPTVYEALVVEEFDELDYANVMNENSCFGSLTVVEESNEKILVCSVPTNEKFDVLQTGPNVSISEIKSDTVEQLCNRTFNLENNDTEISNENSPFNSLVPEKFAEEAMASNVPIPQKFDELDYLEVINGNTYFGSLTVIEESNEESEACSILTTEQFDELKINANVSDSDAKADASKQYANQVFDLENNDDLSITNENSSFNSLTVIEKSVEEAVACDAPIQEKSDELIIDINISVFERKVQARSQTSDLETNHAAKINESLSFCSSSFTEKIREEIETRDDVDQIHGVKQSDVYKPTTEMKIDVIEDQANLISDLEMNDVESKNSNSFDSSIFVEKSAGKAVSCDISIQDKFSELHIDVNTSVSKIDTDAVQQLSNLEKNSPHENVSSDLLILSEKVTHENSLQHFTLADETLAENNQICRSDFDSSNEIVSLVQSTPTTFAVPNNCLRSTKIQKLRHHFNDMLSPFRENLIRFRTPMKRNEDEMARQSYDGNVKTNTTTKIIFELPGSILDLSIGELESLTSKKLPTVVNTNDKVPIELSTSRCLENNDVVQLTTIESVKSRKLDFEKSETEESETSLKKELEEIKKELSNFTMEHQVLLFKYDSLWHKYKKLHQQYDKAQKETEKLAEAAKNVLAQKISLQKAIKDYEDIARVSSNKFELLKEYSNTLIMQMNQEMEEKEKEINALKSKTRN